jgi:peptidoglycan/LPS O-acetylase OafA/YrhL
MAGEQPWQTQYTLLAFGLSIAAAVLVTYLIEKPAGKWLKRKFGSHTR